MRIREKLGGLRMQEALDALDQGDLRTAAAIGLSYYDKLYQHTRQRYARTQYEDVDCTGLDVEAAARAVLQATGEA